MQRMLEISGIPDATIKTGVVTYGGKGGGDHAWVKIGESEYDPTWDAKHTKDTWVYFAIPRDVMGIREMATYP